MASRRESLVVHGRVTRAGGRPLVRVVVVAFDRDLRSRQELGRARTDAEGNYRIAYTRKQFARSEKLSADLLLHVVRGEDVLHQSRIVFNSGPDAEVDLVVADENAVSEYDELLDELKGLLGQHELAELVQDEEHDDITFLAGETSLVESHITFAVLAHRLEAQTGISPAAFYGLFRSTLPTDLPGLLAAFEKEDGKPTSTAMPPSRTLEVTPDGDPPTPTLTPTTTPPTSSTTPTASVTPSPTETTTEDPTEMFLSDIPVGDSRGLNQNPSLTLNGTFYPDSIEVGCIFGMGKTLAPFAVGGYATFDATIGVNDADPSPEVQQEIPCTVKILTGSKIIWQGTIKPTEVRHISFPLNGAARINIECSLNGPAKGYNVGRYPLGFGSAKVMR